MRRTRALISALGLSFALVACGGSGDSGGGSTSDEATVTSPADTAASDDDSSEESDDGSTSGADLCSEVTGEMVSSTLGIEIVETRPLTMGERFRIEDDGTPSCGYVMQNTFFAMSAETTACETYAAIAADTVFPMEPFPGVGDEAFATPDQITSGNVTKVIARSGDTCMIVNYSTSATPDQATTLTNALLGI
jgi:hypothetical protein